MKRDVLAKDYYWQIVIIYMIQVQCFIVLYGQNEIDAQNKKKFVNIYNSSRL